jgi:hypothetical protein
MHTRFPFIHYCQWQHRSHVDAESLKNEKIYTVRCPVIRTLAHLTSITRDLRCARPEVWRFHAVSFGCHTCTPIGCPIHKDLRPPGLTEEP